MSFFCGLFLLCPYSISRKKERICVPSM